ncbi:hypothetical protein VSQ32_11575 [Lachnospiraceae bacterium KK002]
MEYLPKELREAFEYEKKNCKELDLDRNLVNVSDVLKAHYILADYFTDTSAGGMSEKMLVGVRSYDLLASALGRQSVEFRGKRKYTNKLDICATLFFGLVKDHAFHDDGVIIGTRLEKPSKINGFALLSPIFLSHAGWREDGAVHINTYYTESQMGLCA